MTSAPVPHIDKVTNCQSCVVTDGLTAGPVCCSFSQASSCLSMGLRYALSVLSRPVCWTYCTFCWSPK